MKNKAIIIPGWMDVGENYPGHDALEIWKEKISDDIFIDSEFVVGHSMGAHFALLNWDKNKNYKLILVNPLLIQKNIFYWFRKWIKYRMIEGLPKGFKHATSPASFLWGIKKFVFLVKYDVWEIIDNIPQSDIVVIRGKKDDFFCNDKVAEFIKSKDIQLIEIEEAGHNWNEKIDEEIRKIVSE
jgi:pimeloyl-ACP methyl ester carboxylesterase